MRIGQRGRKPDDLRQWLAGVGAVLLIALAVAGLHACGVQVCLFHRLTGLPCLTCGSTRALAALAAGDVAGAFRQQPLAVAAALALGAGFAVHTFFLVALRRRVSVRLEAREWRAAGLALAALAALNWAYLVWRGV